MKGSFLFLSATLLILAFSPLLLSGAAPCPIQGVSTNEMNAGKRASLSIVTRANGVSGRHARTTASPPQPTVSEAASLSWQVIARLRHGPGSISGTLKLDGEGVEFQSPKGFSRRWPFVEIQTLDLWPRRIVLIGYEKCGRFRPGVRRYRFDPGSEMPPSVAAELVRRVGRPVRNGNPQPEASSIATLSAHHRTGLGGTKSNGILRFGEWGIDYVTSVGKDSRSWRWGDIQTLSNPDAYHLTVFGYLE